jgi:hypothetical protein
LYAIPRIEQSDGEVFDAWLPVEHTVQSLAVSRAAGCMQYKLLEGVHDICSQLAAAPSLEAWVSTRQFPMLVDEDCVKRAAVQKTTIPDPRREWLVAKLNTSFEADPLEDGLGHPAEKIIGEALHSVRSELVLGWLEKLVLDSVRPSFAASVLRCLGRQTSPGTVRWRSKLVRAALALDDVELRDAAVQAAEMWGDREMVDILKSHREPGSWLRQYIREVINDLCE